MQASGDDGWFQRIVDTFHPNSAELEHALAETERTHQREHDDAMREIEDRQRRRFRSFIWIVTDDGAHSFLTATAETSTHGASLAGGREDLPEPTRLEAVRRRVWEHYQETGGKYIGLGQILRCQFASHFDHSIVLDTDGSVIEKNGGRFLLGEVWMELHR